MTDTIVALGVVFLAALYLGLRVRRAWTRRRDGSGACSGCAAGCPSADAIGAYLREKDDAVGD